MPFITRKPGKKPRKYDTFEATWDEEHGWWDIKRSIPAGITCGIIKPEDVESVSDAPPSVA